MRYGLYLMRNGEDILVVEVEMWNGLWRASGVEAPAPPAIS